MIPHTDETAKKIAKKFCHQVVWLLQVRRIFAELFENDESQFLMEKTARSFFVDLGRIMHCYLLLECAKITDPAQTSGKENFTLDNLIESIEWPSDVREELKSLKDKIQPFRNCILNARHKLLAHTDKEIFLTDRTLGEFPEGEDKEFLMSLQRFCDVTHKACFGTIFRQICLNHSGDVIDFKGTLERAVAFKELLSESSGQDKTRLFSYLQKVRNSHTSLKGEAPKEGSL